MEEDFGLYIGDDEISVASDVASDDDLVDDQFEEVVVYDDGDLHQERVSRKLRPRKLRPKT